MTRLHLRQAMRRPSPLDAGEDLAERLRDLAHLARIREGHTLSCASAMSSDGERCRCRVGRGGGGGR